jgi:hypothetical protein
MNEMILEYLRLLLSWPAVSLLIIFIFRKYISLFLTSINRGFEAKFAGVSLRLPPLEIKEESTDGPAKKASINIAYESDPELSQFHIYILKKFYEKGDYDTLTVSKNLIETFRELKLLGFLGWESETMKNGSFILKNFILTKTAKDLVGSNK